MTGLHSTDRSTDTSVQCTELH